MTAAAAAAEGLRHDIQHQEEVGGLVYRVARSEEDIKRAMDFMFEVFLKGEQLQPQQPQQQPPHDMPSCTVQEGAL